METTTTRRIPGGDWPTRDMPADLAPGERQAYARGYARGITTHTRRTGGTGVTHDGPAPRAGTPERAALAAALTTAAIENEAARHDTCHRAAMAALRKYRKQHGLETPTAPRKPAARKPAKTRAVPVSIVPDIVPDTMPDQTPAAVTESAREDTPDAPHAWNTRRAARRALAAAMRERGENPADADAWAAAKALAGVR